MTETKKRDKSKKRTVIINAALDIFVTMGYELASMDRIAEKAGVSKKTVYNHFDSKENLFEIIVDNLLSERQNLKTIIYDANKSLEEQLIEFAESEIFLIDSPSRLELSRFLTTTFLSDLEFQRRIVAKYPPVYNMLIDWLKEAEHDGRLKMDNTLVAGRIFYALVIGSITWPALFTDGIDKQVIKPILSELIAVFLARYANNE